MLILVNDAAILTKTVDPNKFFIVNLVTDYYFCGMESYVKNKNK